MKKKEIRKIITDYLSDRLNSLGIGNHEISGDFDFVQSGLLDSMAFVDMVTSFEKQFGIEIDFEAETENNTFTTMDGLLSIFYKEINE